MAACAPLPVHDDFEYVVGAHQRARAHGECAERLARPVVHAVHRMHRKAVEQAFLDHHPAPAFVLFGGLEDEVHRAREVLLARERCGGAEQHGRVAVVAARMHPAFVARGIGHTRALLDVQRIEIRAQADRIAGADCAAEHGNQAGLGEARVHFQTEGAELVGNERARRRLLEGGLRMGVQMMTPRLHVRNERGDFGDDVHGVNPTTRMASRMVTQMALGAARTLR